MTHLSSLIVNPLTVNNKLQLLSEFVGLRTERYQAQRLNNKKIKNKMTPLVSSRLIALLT